VALWLQTADPDRFKSPAPKPKSVSNSRPAYAQRGHYPSEIRKQSDNQAYSKAKKAGPPAVERVLAHQVYQFPIGPKNKNGILTDYFFQGTEPENKLAFVSVGKPDVITSRHKGNLPTRSIYRKFES
jgi:hypothetical protein